MSETAPLEEAWYRMRYSGQLEELQPFGAIERIVEGFDQLDKSAHEASGSHVSPDEVIEVVDWRDNPQGDQYTFQWQRLSRFVVSRPGVVLGDQIWLVYDQTLLRKKDQTTCGECVDEMFEIASTIEDIVPIIGEPGVTVAVHHPSKR